MTAQSQNKTHVLHLTEIHVYRYKPWRPNHRFPYVCDFYDFRLVKITDYMENSSSWEVYSRSFWYWIPCILWHSKVHSRFHKIPPLALILSQANTVGTALFCSSMSPSVLLYHFFLRFTSFSYLQVSRPKFCVHYLYLPHILHASSVSLFPWFDYRTNIPWRAETSLPLIMKCFSSLLHACTL
jgi:hypothetical protein